MSACCFFGHKDAYCLDYALLVQAIREQIQRGDDVFYIGHQGAFDTAVYGCLKRLREEYPDIRICVVLAYLPTEKAPEIPDSMFPEGLEMVHPKYAIDKRNHWMITASDSCICYVDHTWGGAYKFAKIAQKRGLRVTNIGRAKL